MRQCKKVYMPTYLSNHMDSEVQCPNGHVNDIEAQICDPFGALDGTCDECGELLPQ